VEETAKPLKMELLELKRGIDLVPEVNRMLAAGWPMYRVANELGISQPTLRAWLQRAGLRRCQQWVGEDQERWEIGEAGVSATCAGRR